MANHHEDLDLLLRGGVTQQENGGRGTRLYHFSHN